MIIAIFLIISLIFFYFYFFSKKKKFSFDNLLFGLWFLSIGIGQLRLSSLEQPYSINFWIILSIFFCIFYVTYNFCRKRFLLNADENKLKETGINIDEKLLVFIVALMTIISVGVNIYIYIRFGTMPILSSAPDKMRFVINKELFGPIEYLSFLPRIFIPLAFIYLVTHKEIKKSNKNILITSIVIGFIILCLYASRVIIIFPILMCYFSYLIIKIKEINLKQIIISSVIVVSSVIFLSVSIPIFRQYITYKDYYGNIYNEETGTLDINASVAYLLNISKIKLPKQLSVVAPLYIIPSFNLQTLYHATTYFNSSNFYHGRYLLSISDPFLKLFGIHLFDDIKIQWKDIFLPWWNTGTFLFDFWADFGYLGIVFAGVLFGIIFSILYILGTSKKNLLSTMLFAYFSFFVIMSIYTNYIRRAEFYLDIFVIAILQTIFYYYSKNKDKIEQKIYAVRKNQTK